MSCLFDFLWWFQFILMMSCLFDFLRWFAIHQLFILPDLMCQYRHQKCRALQASMSLVFSCPFFVSMNQLLCFILTGCIDVILFVHWFIYRVIIPSWLILRMEGSLKSFALDYLFDILSTTLKWHDRPSIPNSVKAKEKEPCVTYLLSWWRFHSMFMLEPEQGFTAGIQHLRSQNCLSERLDDATRCNYMIQSFINPLIRCSWLDVWLWAPWTHAITGIQCEGGKGCRTKIWSSWMRVGDAIS